MWDLMLVLGEKMSGRPTRYGYRGCRKMLCRKQILLTLLAVACVNNRAQTKRAYRLSLTVQEL
jgi:hypothetical protein